MTNELTAIENNLRDLREWCIDLDKHVNERLGFIEKTLALRDGEIEACHRIMAECRQIAGQPNGMTVKCVRDLLLRAEKAEHDLAEMTAVYASAQRNAEEWQALCNNQGRRAEAAEEEARVLRSEITKRAIELAAKSQHGKRNKPCVYRVNEHYNFTPGCTDEVTYSFLDLPVGPFCTHCGHLARIPRPEAQP